MKIYIYSEAPKEFYFNSLKVLKEREQISSYEFINRRLLKPLLKNALLKFGLIKNRSYEKIGVKEFFIRLFAPFRLFFKNNIIIGAMPYDFSVLYFTLLKIFGKKIIYHNSWPYWEGGKRLRVGSRLFWEFFLKRLPSICISKKSADSISKFGAIIYHIPHSVNVTKFHPNSERRNKEEIIILSVARLEKYKGIEDLIEIVKEKLLPQNVKVVICGQGSLEEKVRIVANKMSQLEFVPYNVELLPKLYRSADIFVLNSFATEIWEELFGIVILEAMASGLSVISTDCIGPKEIIKDGINGILIPQKNKNAIVEKIKFLIGNPNLRHKIGEAARKEIETNFNENIISQKWFEVLNKCFK